MRARPSAPIRAIRGSRAPCVCASRWLLPMNLRFRREERAERREGNPPRPPTLARARPGSWLQFTPKSLWGSVLSMNRPFAVRSAEDKGRVGRASVSRAANGSWPRFASNRWRFPLPMNLRFRREERAERREGNPPRPPTLARARPGSRAQSVLSMHGPWQVDDMKSGQPRP
jgi:hypothetical protein